MEVPLQGRNHTLQPRFSNILVSTTYYMTRQPQYSKRSDPTN